ncbi:DNA repair protein RadC [Caldisericum exile AZM16c01]|uniref:DNA repair protein RadC n=1 Tax=Caldisericum exile (strain DSM 21853 / NBRC 104410 / AZM16c01) TaxID=511051 RepID=A0A7U6GDU1_CALEA|nr:DNA repair protein RadC [Caldisericum exile AZM16c01]
MKNDLRNARKKANSHVPIKDWIESERPREALLKNGAETLSLSKLLAIILRTGSDGVSAEELGKRILNKYKSLRALDEAPLKN